MWQQNSSLLVRHYTSHMVLLLQECWYRWSDSENRELQGEKNNKWPMRKRIHKHTRAASSTAYASSERFLLEIWYVIIYRVSTKTKPWLSRLKNKMSEKSMYSYNRTKNRAAIVRNACRRAWKSTRACKRGCCRAQPKNRFFQDYLD